MTPDIESPCPLVFDHLVLRARTLAEGAAHVKDQLGIDMPPGGAHPRMGTHNLLLSLGADCFLEVVAIDPDAPAPGHARWFGLDRFNSEPKLGTWALGTRDIARSLAALTAVCGRAIEMTRGDLSWLISVREDGALPLSGACPTLLQWPEGPHPAARMGDRGCHLQSLRVSHPEAEMLRSRLAGALDDPRIEIVPGPLALEAVIMTPHGARRLR